MLASKNLDLKIYHFQPLTDTFPLRQGGFLTAQQVFNTGHLIRAVTI